MKASVLTLGCKVNQSESSLIEADLRKNGWNIVDLKEKPDYCVINTCSVTSKSDYQSRQLIRRANNMGAKIIVTGCYSELNKNAVMDMEGVMMLVENKNKLNFVKTLADDNINIIPNYNEYGRSRFFLKIQDGCNYSCSYCVIPMARGKSRSMIKEDVINRINQISHIFSEVIISGIHLGTYGYDLIPKVKLSEVLRDILLFTNIERIRLSSLEIKEIDEDLLDLIQDKRVCKHLHIPLQSGDDNILINMHRNYNSREFFDKISRIFKAIPDISIGSDIIIGFPGEGEKEFENTQKFLESLPISYLHVFPYSRREKTKAAEIGNDVASSIKKERCHLVRELGKGKKHEYMSKQIGRTLDLLIEEICDENIVTGITGNYLRLEAPINRPAIKSIVPVRVAEVNKDVLFGYPIEKR